MAPIMALALAAVLPAILAQSDSSETVLGVYIFHRHGDRTPKILAPANLTDLGYLEVYQSGQYYRNRYVASDASNRISGMNSDLVLQSQIQASAPDDDVLQNSATGFLQALYPPVGSSLDSETLANGSSVTAPMDGYQLIPVELVESGSGSEDSSWLQSSTGCYKAELSSNEYFDTPEYNDLLQSTQDFYTNLLPVIKPMFNSTTASYMNAYTIWDYLNVAEIHNSSIQHGDLLTSSVRQRLFDLSNNLEWNLAYNSSEPIRAVAGKTLGAQVVQFLDSTIEAAGSQTGSKLAVQFGSYGSFSSFFGLADLPSVNTDFTGVTDYASSMAFEMFTNTSSTVTSSNYPSANDIYVRFLYKNGTATDATPPQEYALFGMNQNVLAWSDFKSHMNSFAIGNTASWCTACGNSTGICEGYGPGTDDSGSSSGSYFNEHGSVASGNGLSPAVNGVIGAMVTLIVVLGLEALAMLVFGLRLAKKSTLAAATAASNAKA